jgi:hypothetical protein
MEVSSRHRPARAFAITLLSAVVCVASAHAAGSGGVGMGGGGVGPGVAPGLADDVGPGCPHTQLGKRTLRLGDCGGDVATLNWILKAKDFGEPELVDEFEDSTETAVEQFQRTARLPRAGVVDADTSAALVNAMPLQRATWYGPGFFGNETACGQTLTRRTYGVAHKTLPCGSKVVVRYRGRFVRTTVIDRGPFANGAKWDLTQATARALRFEYTDDIRVAKIAARTPTE